MSHRIIIIFFFVLLPLFLNAATVTSLYNYTTDKQGNPALIDKNCDGTKLDRVNGAKKPNSGCSTGFMVTSFQKTKTFSPSLEAIEITITPHLGYTLSASSISADLRRSNSGILSIRFAYSLDGSAWTDAGVDGSPKQGSCGDTKNIAWDFKDFTTTKTVYFRIYGFNASSGSVALQILNLNVNGSATILDNDGDTYAPPEDCNDNNAAIHPNATEICNGIDDNCNGQIDENLFATYYGDVDKDGFGNLLITISSCSGIPSGYVTNNSDCNDNNATINPNSKEVCNGFDDNCNNQFDEGLPLFVYYTDSDHDGYIDVGALPFTTCITPMPFGYSVTAMPKTDFKGTTTSFKINPYLFEGMAEQICVGGKSGTMDIGAGLYFLHADSLGLNGYTYGGASPSWHYHLAMDRLFKGGKGNGWNCLLYSKEKNPQCDKTIIQGMCCNTYDVDFFNKCAFDFTNKLKLKPSLDFIANPMTAEAWEVDTAIARGRTKFLYVSLENCLGGDLPAQTYPKGGSDYVALNNPRIDAWKSRYHDVVIIGDAGSVIKTIYKNWNDALRLLHADAMRQYLSDSDMYEYPKKFKDFSQLRDTVLRALNYKLPAQMDAFKNEFHGLKCSPAHTGADNRLQMVDYNSMLKELWIGGYKIWELNYDYANGGFFCNSLIQSVKALSMESAIPKNDYRTLQLISDLYHGNKQFVKIDIGLDSSKVKAVGGYENGAYTIIVANLSDTDYKEAGITLDGHFYSLPTSARVMNAANLEDVNLKIQNIPSFDILPISISKFTFAAIGVN